MTEFRIAKGWALVAYISASLLILVFASLLLMPFFPAWGGDSTDNYFFLAAVSFVLIVLTVYALLDTARSRFVIEKDRVWLSGAFGTRELLLHEIAGYRINDQGIQIIPVYSGAKKIRINKYYGNRQAIVDWLAAHFPDLDEQQAAAEFTAILENENFGQDTGTRTAQLQKTLYRSRLLNWAGTILGGWALLYPVPYSYAVVAAMLLPLVLLLMLWRHRGLMRVAERKHSAYPSVFWAFFAATMAVCLRSLLDYNLLAYQKLWALVLPLALVFSLLVARLSRMSLRDPDNRAHFVLILALAVGYVFGALVLVNCTFDHSTPQLFTASVRHKNISSGKTTTYYLQLSPWGNLKEPEEVAVSRSLYRQVRKNDQVRVYQKSGVIGIPWFVVTK